MNDEQTITVVRKELLHDASWKYLMEVILILDPKFQRDMYTLRWVGFLDEIQPEVEKMIGRIEVARIEGVNLWRTSVFTNKKDIFQGENQQWSDTLKVLFFSFFLNPEDSSNGLASYTRPSEISPSWP